MKPRRKKKPLDQAVEERRTPFQKRVYPVSRAPNGPKVLKRGKNWAKIGDLIIRGHGKGFPVYVLSLQERDTCQLDCFHWHDCYGNGSKDAHRFKHGPDLEWRLPREVAELSIKHPRGFAVRLHGLGEFYDPRYVRLWARLLDNFPALHVFGMTHLWNVKTDPIAAALLPLIRKRWNRFAIRVSYHAVQIPQRTVIADIPAAVTIQTPHQKPAGFTICPEQEGKHGMSSPQFSSGAAQSSASLSQGVATRFDAGC
jgi:hypothetical protein